MRRKCEDSLRDSALTGLTVLPSLAARSMKRVSGAILVVLGVISAMPLSAVITFKSPSGILRATLTEKSAPAVTAPAVRASAIVISTTVGVWIICSQNHQSGPK